MLKALGDSEAEVWMMRARSLGFELVAPDFEK